MADITLCTAKDCPYINKCARAITKPNKFYQSYYDFSLTCNQDSGFDSYLLDYSKRK